MLNYEVDPSLLKKHVPRNTELDSFRGRAYITLVGFRFSRTKLFGSLPVPFHTDFDEVNLRFYVRRKEKDEDRRGVVFVAEIVPKWAVATAPVANRRSTSCFSIAYVALTIAVLLLASGGICARGTRAGECV